MNEHSIVRFVSGKRDSSSISHYKFEGSNSSNSANDSKSLVIDMIGSIAAIWNDGIITKIKVEADFIPNDTDGNTRDVINPRDDMQCPTSITRLMSTAEMKDLFSLLDDYALGDNHTLMILPEVKDFIDKVMPKICAVWNGRIIHSLLDLSQNMLLNGDTVHFVDLNKLFDTLGLEYHIDDTLEEDGQSHRYMLNVKH